MPKQQYKVYYLQPRMVSIEARNVKEAIAFFEKGEYTRKQDKKLLSEDVIITRVDMDERTWVVSSQGEIE